MEFRATACAEMKRKSIELMDANAGETSAPVRVAFAAMAVLVVMLASPFAVAAAAVDPARLPPAATERVDFARDIKPLFESACVKCHGPEKSKNGFRLDTRAHALVGGENGVDIISGDGANSPLVHFVAGLVPDMEMPPKTNA